MPTLCDLPAGPLAAVLATLDPGSLAALAAAAPATLAARSPAFPGGVLEAVVEDAMASLGAVGGR